MYPGNYGNHGHSRHLGSRSSSYSCPHCAIANHGDAYYCNGCGQKLTIAKLISRGTGLVPRGFSWELKCRDSTMGRSLDNDFVIPAPTISRCHVRFVYCVDGFFVAVDNPTGDVTVDGEPVLLPVSLQDGSLLKICSEQFEVSFF